MAEFPRINGNACAVNHVYNVSANAVLVRVRSNANAAVDLRGETIINGAVEQIVKEIDPLLYYVENNNSGNIHMVVDPTITAADVQHRIRLIGANSYTGVTDVYANTNVGPNHIDLGNTYAYNATSFVVTG
jgi:hypothetical protein